ncbi:MAG: TauD/TfdA family dioxygenase [Gammaproteobacteria bacterium]
MTSPSSTHINEAATGTPFDLGDETAYLEWRRKKLAMCPNTMDELMVEIHDGWHIAASEWRQITDCCRRANMAVYCLKTGDFADKALIQALGKEFGLRRLDKNLRADEDAITSLRMVEGGDSRRYIPYGNRALSWHTDGYYNPMHQQVRGVIMHCVSAAAEGGDNLLIDHEMIYLQLRDENPEFVAALMRPDAMIIPANVEDGVQLREPRAGPVFSVDPETGSLHMRYTARSRNIEWSDDTTTKAAVAYLGELMEGDSACIFRLRLTPGQGIICNNVLHGRTAFEDHAQPDRRRLLYRARYYDRITDKIKDKR